MKIFISASAEAELEESKLFYNRERKGLGDEFLDELESTFSFIEANPRILAVSRFNTRRCSLDRFPFTIVYRIDNEVIEVVAVAHQKRRPEYWKKRVKKNPKE